MSDTTSSAARGIAGALATLPKLIAKLGVVRSIGTAALILLVLLVARGSWEFPLIVDAERNFYDWRVGMFTPKVDQDQRIVMVVYDDDTLINTRKRSPLDRALLAKALTQIDRMQPKAIGIDILFDQPQDEDPQLLAALRAMRTPTQIAYANVATNADSIGLRQQAFLDDFMGKLRGSNAHPSSIRVIADEDNVQRSWNAAPKGLPPLLAAAMAGTDNGFGAYQGSIAWRLPKARSATETAPVFSEMEIDPFANPAVAPAFADQIRGKYVLIGGNIRDTDQFVTPLSTTIAGERATVPGLEIHASMLAQLLDGKRLPSLSNWAMWLIAALVVIGGGITALIETSAQKSAALGIVQVGAIIGSPFLLQKYGVDTQFLPAFGWVIGWFASSAIIGTAARVLSDQQRRFAQSALSKYLPRNIAAEILRDPKQLALHGEKREVFVLFSDLEGFTELSSQIEPEMVATLLNRYLDMLCQVVLDHGGTLDKFVGDAVVAFWGAPIARPDDGERAAKAAYAMWQAGETFRQTAPPGVPPIGKTRVGLHWGEAIIGNFGGEGRIQYTGLGDTMNTASRLESANKKLDSRILVSREAMDRSGLDWWRPLGCVRLRGRAAPVDLFEPVPGITKADVEIIQDILDKLANKRADATEKLRALVAENPGDTALANLLNRVAQLDAGGVYAVE